MFFIYAAMPIGEKKMYSAIARTAPTMHTMWRYFHGVRSTVLVAGGFHGSCLLVLSKII